MERPDATIEFTVDEAHLREHHTQWVARLGKNWREWERTAGFGSLLAIALAVVAVGADPVWMIPSVLLFGLELFGIWMRRRYLESWLADCRALPVFGRKFRFVVRDGKILQDSGTENMPTRSVAFFGTPLGYLVEMDGLVLTGPITGQSYRGALYIPHRAVSPPMSRDTFASLLDLKPLQTLDQSHDPTS